MTEEIQMAAEKLLERKYEISAEIEKLQKELTYLNRFFKRSKKNKSENIAVELNIEEILKNVMPEIEGWVPLNQIISTAVEKDLLDEVSIAAFKTLFAKEITEIDFVDAKPGRGRQVLYSYTEETEEF